MREDAIVYLLLSTLALILFVLCWLIREVRGDNF